MSTPFRLYLQGLNLNISDYDGRTALHLAACEGHTLLLKFLLNVAKVDYHIKDRWGRTALDDARTFHRSACTALLLKTMQKRQKEQQGRRMSSQLSMPVNGLVSLEVFWIELALALKVWGSL
jgi:ankyrin repeat protein